MPKGKNWSTAERAVLKRYVSEANFDTQDAINKIVEDGLLHTRSRSSMEQQIYKLKSTKSETWWKVNQHKNVAETDAEKLQELKDKVLDYFRGVCQVEGMASDKAIGFAKHFNIHISVEL
jgi:hypothetical protein